MNRACLQLVCLLPSLPVHLQDTQQISQLNNHLQTLAVFLPDSRRCNLADPLLECLRKNQQGSQQVNRLVNPQHRLQVCPLVNRLEVLQEPQLDSLRDNLLVNPLEVPLVSLQSNQLDNQRDSRQGSRLLDQQP